MNTENQLQQELSATGEKVYLLDKILFCIWLLVPAYQYSDLHVENSRVGFWGIASILIFRMAIRDLQRRKFIIPSRGLIGPFMLVFGWKFIELMRAPGQINTALLFFVDFLITYACCLAVAPRIFSVRSWLIEFRRVNVFALVLAIVSHPLIPDRTDMAGWDKGASWAFAHPNIAAMYPLAIYLLTIVIFGTGAKRGFRWFDLFCVVFSLGTLAMTGSRTTLGVAVVTTLLALFNVFSLTYLKDSVNGESRTIKAALKLSAMFAVCGIAYFVYSDIGRAAIDALFSGRLSFAADILFSAKDLVLGVGLMPPGANLLADSSTRGAGIDGLYINLVYGEGYVGLVLFVIAMFGLRRMANVNQWCRGFFGVVLISCLLFGVTETHFWLLASPLTALIMVLASTLGTQAGSYMTVFIGKPLPQLISR
ncbi:hypothetical protein B0G81_8211 [Paraburkholderia sp. BL6665CI2N2]|uniref:hypothetical protein n=1 Tax=Paraburkholderia sp. BL6665CI2N2 TaxID=1938806 RepID=UPI0010663A39|nr:hypothetical protein [Paraburkholderia sp. BL6665CI2N2]TDY17038.1 hypothetical protein B0G81_8211 [Paraburkholderia sp. BL6665CI2N2]